MILAKDGELRIARIPTLRVEGYREQSDYQTEIDNGCLIMSAPDLLAAIERIMDDYKRIGIWAFAGEALDMARAAIAKAKGI
jgi:hypothetical protein